MYWEIVTGIPMFIFAITRPRAGDEQPDGWTFKVFVFCIVLSGLVGMLFWATVMKPRINRQKKPVDSEAK